MNATHWFYMLDGSVEHGWRILTYALGNRPVGKYWFETEKERDAFKRELLADGYQYTKNQ
jgi:Zn/Cd-binding protein ZinT